MRPMQDWLPLPAVAQASVSTSDPVLVRNSSSEAYATIIPPEMASKDNTEFPYSLTIHTPFPTHRLAQAALRSLSVDPELSLLVQRAFTLVEPVPSNENDAQYQTASDSGNILCTEYRATTNRMLRVAVNGFFDSLGTVIHVMEDLDVDVLHEKGLEGLEGVQGVEQGLTGTAGG